MSSLMVADGEPAHVLGLVDPDSDLWTALNRDRLAVVQLLGWEHRSLADVFAGQAPAPGGAFRAAAFHQTSWGPLVAGAGGWLGVRLSEEPPMQVGWSMLARAVVEHAEIGPETDPLVHRRGRYLRPQP